MRLLWKGLSTPSWIMIHRLKTTVLEPREHQFLVGSQKKKIIIFFLQNVQCSFPYDLKMFVVCIFVYHMSACVCHNTCVVIWGPLWESVLSFHHVDPGDQTQAIALIGKSLYLWDIFPAS